jgi:hypothetical protein
LNSPLSSSFAGAVVGDFDGDGKSDIAYSSGGSWYYSPGGRSPQKLLRSGPSPDPYPPLKSMLLGSFDSSGRTGLVSFERQISSSASGPSVVTGNGLVLWPGAGANAFSPLSLQEMR